MLEDADVDLILLHPELADWAAPALERLSDRRIERVPSQTEVDPGGGRLEPGRVDPEATLTLLYTSGSTGRPKGWACPA